MNRNQSPLAHRALHRGFTLIELLAAMTLFAVLSAILFGTLRTAERSTTATTLSNDRTEQYTRTHAFLSEQLANVLPLRWRRELGQPLKFAGRTESVTYLAPVTSYIAEGGILWWQLVVVSNGDKKQLVLKRLPQDPEVKEVPDLAEAEAIILAENIDKLTLSYFDIGEDPVTQPESGKWVEAWSEENRMPSLLRIRVAESNGTVWPDLVVPLAISQAVGCNFNYAKQQCFIQNNVVRQR
jgi:general secretion pathway protein J